MSKTTQVDPSAVHIFKAVLIDGTSKTAYIASESIDIAGSCVVACVAKAEDVGNIDCTWLQVNDNSAIVTSCSTTPSARSRQRGVQDWERSWRRCEDFAYRSKAHLYTPQHMLQHSVVLAIQGVE
jgi:hypothetical protein